MTTVRVLVAEDEPIFRAALADLIAGQSSLELVGTAQDADEAVEIARRERPNVALLDVRMPGGGGPKATREICALLPETKVLALSAAGDRDAVFGMLRAGAIGYLLKDVSPEGLVRSITKAAAGQAILSRTVTADVIDEFVILLDRSESFSEELQAFDRTKSELIQVLSHELRTPVTVIQGTVKTLVKPGIDLSSEKVADMVAGALRAMSRLSRLAANVSAAAQLGHEGTEVLARDLPVNELISMAVGEFPHQQDSIILAAQDREASAQISVNPDLATRALVVVLENALELAPETPVEVGVRVKGREVDIYISDRGPGVPVEFRDQIFEPFAQLDSSSTRTHQGLGVGLFLARRIMQAHRGRIEMLDRIGGGTTFILTFDSAPQLTELRR